MFEHPTQRQEIEAVKSWVASQEFDQLRADAAQTAIKLYQAAIVDLAQLNAAAIRSMAERGFSTTELAREFGISRARIDQIVNR